jgi:hypothetical protein
MSPEKSSRASEDRAARDASLPKLTRRVDERSRRRFLEVTGSRVALLGDELGVFEAWMWPLQVARELEICVHAESDGIPRLHRGRDLARTVSVRPDRVEIELAGPGFRVREVLLASLDRRAAVVACDVETERDLALELRFTPELKPMWPAGLGGRVALRDEETGAFAITEELGRFAVLFGSPEAEPLEVRADHSLPREPVAIRVPVSAARAKKGSVTFFLAGAQVDAPPLTRAARVGEEDAAKGYSRSHEVLRLAREELRSIESGWRDVASGLEEHWTDFLGRTADFHSDDALHEEAFLWAKIAIEKAWVEVDGLGRGLVAGLAPSGLGDRPGFGWLFDGDALVASRAMSGYGDREGAQRVFRFAASHQREDGKMMHELVLSARLCDWLGDFPYAYYKANTTPGFVSSLDHYLYWSDDRELLQELWPSALAAYRCCLAHLEEDGLLSDRRLGMAAVEAGSLVGRIRGEVYLQAIWISALRGIARMAAMLGHSSVAEEADAHRNRAEQAFEGFWCEEHGRYGFAQLTDGTLCVEPTAYQAVAASRGIGKPERSLATIAQLNRPNLASDWGVRFFPRDCALYGPEDYNTGSVFPYANNFAILALFRHGLATAGRQLLASQVALHGFSGLGFVPEHLQGDSCETPARGVPHQIFSSACIVQSTLFGMLGLRVAQTSVPVLFVQPSLPPMLPRAGVARLRVGDRELDLEIRRGREGRTTVLSYELELRAGSELSIMLAPMVPPLSRGARAAFAGDPRGVPAQLARHGGSLAITVPPFTLTRRETVTVTCESGPELVPDTSPLVEGERSSRLRVCETVHDERAVEWTLWGRAGRTYALPYRTDRELDFAGARPTSPRELEITFPGRDDGSFVSTRLRATARD